MLMRSLKKNARYGRHGESGFSLIEMMMVAAIGIIATAITFLSMGPVMKQQRITNAYNTTLGALRQARDNSIAQSTFLKPTSHAGTNFVSASIAVNVQTSPYPN